MDDPEQWGIWDAIGKDDIQAIEHFVNAGKDISLAGDQRGYTCLHYAAQEGKTTIVASMLKARNVDMLINKFDDISHTPLIWAAKEGHLEIVRSLLLAGANINICDAERAGNTAIRVAVEGGHLNVVQLLLDEGADPTIPGWMQISAKDKAELNYKKIPTARNKEILDAIKLGKRNKQ